ncbi:MAG: hypothetical protein KIT22_13240 [Verrucomicrobiae bacterium]|nr:hypothetical protein [Verrucomicrobiae bacterium]
MWSERQAIEIFHLSFIAQFGRRQSYYGSKKVWEALLQQVVEALEKHQP